MRKHTWVLGLAGLGLGASLAAAPPSTAPQADRKAPEVVGVTADAMRLSNLLNPTDKMVEIGVKGFEIGFDAALQRSPKEAAVYASSPGLRDAILEAGRPVIEKHLALMVPRRQQTYARFYAANFTAEEIGQLIAFYSTPTGAKVVAAMYSGVPLGKIAQTMSMDGDSKLTAESVNQFNQTAVAGLPDKFDSEDWKVLFVFSATPAHAKLLRVAPDFAKLVADTENEPNPAMDEELDKAVEAAVQTYMAKHKAKPIG
jgi:hypothetical protein